MHERRIEEKKIRVEENHETVMMKGDVRVSITLARTHCVGTQLQFADVRGGNETYVASGSSLIRR